MSSYILDTKLLASCSKYGRVVSATPYYTLWDKMTPSHTNSSFLEQYCIFRLLYLPGFFAFYPSRYGPNFSKKSPIISLKMQMFQLIQPYLKSEFEKTNKKKHTCKLIIWSESIYRIK